MSNQPVHPQVETWTPEQRARIAAITGKPERCGLPAASLAGSELRAKINEVAGYIRTMEQNGTRRSARGRYLILKEKLEKLTTEWQQTPDAAAYAARNKALLPGATA